MLASCALAHMFDAILCSRLKTWIVGPSQANVAVSPQPKPNFALGVMFLPQINKIEIETHDFQNALTSTQFQLPRLRKAKSKICARARAPHQLDTVLLLLLLLLLLLPLLLLLLLFLLLLLLLLWLLVVVVVVVVLVDTTLLYSLHSLEKFVYRKFQLSFLSLRIK